MNIPFIRQSVFSKNLPRHRRSGLSLVEIMIALTMTLIVLGAMMQAFQYASIQMQGGRAIMEMANQTRTAESLIRSDLDHISLEPRPYAQATHPPGFLEYVEGPRLDKADAFTGNVNSYLGDVDDMLGFTVRNVEQPYRGRNVAGAIIESPLAEVWWYTTHVDLNSDTVVDFDESIRIHRRVLLIRPDFGVLDTIPSANIPTIADVDAYMQSMDISCRVVPTSATTWDVVANDLRDLAARSNRFSHIASTWAAHNFPNHLDRLTLVARSHPTGDDILLTNVCGFDVKVYSPDANVVIPAGLGLVVETNDPGYTSGGGVDLGGYVDLAYSQPLPSAAATDDGWFSPIANANYAASKAAIRLNYEIAPGFSLYENVWDTFSPSYESDGIDQDNDGTIDEGTDGIDNDGANGVDDIGERETLPPYTNPMRGIQISFRLIEKNTKQIHQTTVVHSFVPE